MERRVPVIQRTPQILLLVTMLLSAESSWADREVVLVTSRDSAVESLSTLDIRKAYLGIAVLVGGEPVRAIRRRDDKQLNEIFLQSVMAMSHRSYERRLLSLVLKFGTPRPVEVDEREDLVKLLLDRPNSISYMWKSDAESDPRVKSIKVLWQET